jgi:UDPglucose 6-dehydrogenase
MKVGFIGLGKLGFPCAVALEQVGGHEVRGFDVSPSVAKILSEKTAPYIEQEFPKYLKNTNLILEKSIDDLLNWAEIIFIAVQTPHSELYEGATPVPDSKMDFDYSILESVAKEISVSLEKNPIINPLIVVISTVLPGTMKDKVLPYLAAKREEVRFCYNPYFIAMGTTIPDFLHPEFVLVGSLREEDGNLLERLYSTIHKAPVKKMKIESAELTKVAYNTFIGFKIVFANTLAEITAVRGGDVDEITDALSLATKRLMSGKYLRAGMGDGGGCHPRDQIAMSWLADDAGLSVDIFGWLARARDSQTRRQAEFIKDQFLKSGLPICLLGWAYKPDTSLIDGSPARLLGSYLEKEQINFTIFDPFVFPDIPLPRIPSLFFVSTNHSSFLNLDLPSGSIVIDPWGMQLAWGHGNKIIRPGRESLI